MQNLKLLLKHRNLGYTLVFIAVFVVYLYLIRLNFIRLLDDFDYIFGYADQEHFWRSAEEFIHFKVPFKDFYFEYGWGFLAFYALGYLMVGRTFLGSLISTHVILPIAGVVMIYIIGKNIFNKKYLILIFLLLLLPFETIHTSVSIRHLVAELALAFFIGYLSSETSRYIKFAGLIAGLGILFGTEYGVVVTLTIGGIIFITAIIDKNFFNKIKVLGQFMLFALSPILLFLGWLYFEGALVNYFNFSSNFMQKFYFASPCAYDSFSRLAEGFGKVQLQKLNFYIVPVYYLFVLSRCFLVEKNRVRKLTLFSLATYGLVIYSRTLSTPCFQYFVYGLVPLMALVTLDIDILLSKFKQKEIGAKILAIFLLSIITSWVVITGKAIFSYRTPEKIRNRVTALSQEYPIINHQMEKTLLQNYEQIANYIKQNSNRDDYLYVYPWGSYNMLTNRKYVSAHTTVLQAQVAGEEYLNNIKEELAYYAPKLVVINTQNSLGMIVYGTARGDVPVYFGLKDTPGPVFAGSGNIIEKYLLENYQTIFKNEVAIVMGRKDSPVNVEINQGFCQSAQFDLQKKGSDLWEIKISNPTPSNFIRIRQTVDGDVLTKIFSRYILNYSLGTDGVQNFLTKKEEETIKLLTKGKAVEVINVNSVNSGFLWWTQPYKFIIHEIELCRYE